MISNGNNEQVTASSLIEDLKSSDIKIKVAALQNLNVIAMALGKERTRNELIPFLTDCIDEEEDESLIELARAMMNFLDCVGGKTHVGEIFTILEILLTFDEPVINPKECEKDLMEMVNRLTSNDTPAQKQSALQLSGIIFEFVSNSSRAVILNFMLKCISDESSIIKKELANTLKSISSLMDLENLMNMINCLVLDSNDSIRIPVMDILSSLRGHPDAMKLHDFVANLVCSLSLDESWRVRLTVADKTPSILSFPLLDPNKKEKIVNSFVKLLDDSEAETRNICCLKLEEIAEILGKENSMERILIQLKKLEKDTTSYVRAALASTILRICPLVGKQKTNDYIFPIFLNMIKDENHDIRMTLIKSLDRLHEVINIDHFVQSIIPSFVEISSSKSWRTRIQVSESIPVLARILSKSLFIENILGICLNWLTDPVFAIREAACKLMKKLYDIFKGEEFEKKLMEKLNEMKVSTNYLFRNTVLFLIREFVSDEFEVDFIEKKLSGLIFKLSKDRISNVRMNSAFVMKKMSKCIKSKEVLKEAHYCFEELKRDPDVDVINILIDN